MKGAGSVKHVSPTHTIEGRGVWWMGAVITPEYVVRYANGNANVEREVKEGWGVRSVREEREGKPCPMRLRLASRLSLHFPVSSPLYPFYHVLPRSRVCDKGRP